MKSRMLCVCAVIATFVFAAGEHYAFADNGPIGPEQIDPPIVVDAGWSVEFDRPPLFTWADFSGTGAAVFNREGPFTYESATPTLVNITDAFCRGDVFRIYDFGVPIGDTSSVPVDTSNCSPIDPNITFDDPTYSRGRFLVGPGAHSITIQTIVNPLSFGAGFIKVDSVPARELKVAAAEALADIRDSLVGATGVERPDQATAKLDSAVALVESSLTAFLPDNGNRLDADLGADAFGAEENAVDEIFRAVQTGKIVNADILADLRAAIADLHDADDIIAQTAIDDAEADPATDPKDLDLATDDLSRARADAETCELPPYDPMNDGVKGNETEPERSTCDNAIHFYFGSWNRVN